MLPQQESNFRFKHLSPLVQMLFDSLDGGTKFTIFDQLIALVTKPYSSYQDEQKNLPYAEDLRQEDVILQSQINAIFSPEMDTSEIYQILSKLLHEFRFNKNPDDSRIINLTTELERKYIKKIQEEEDLELARRLEQDSNKEIDDVALEDEDYNSIEAQVWGNRYDETKKPTGPIAYRLCDTPDMEQPTSADIENTFLSLIPPIVQQIKMSAYEAFTLTVIPYQAHIEMPHLTAPNPSLHFNYTPNQTNGNPNVFIGQANDLFTNEQLRQQFWESLDFAKKLNFKYMTETQQIEFIQSKLEKNSIVRNSL